jgi:hypothetical protein
MWQLCHSASYFLMSNKNVTFLWLFDPKDEDTKILWNISNCLPSDTASHSRRLDSLAQPLAEHEILHLSCPLFSNTSTVGSFMSHKVFIHNHKLGEEEGRDVGRYIRGRNVPDIRKSGTGRSTFHHCGTLHAWAPDVCMLRLDHTADSTYLKHCLPKLNSHM